MPEMASAAEKDIEVDVEDCSLDNASSRADDEAMSNAPDSESETEKPASSRQVKINPELQPKCNCEELKTVECHLETKDLWKKFDDYGTEMIITKTGR